MTEPRRKLELNKPTLAPAPVIVDGETQGISPKAVLATVAPLVIGIVVMVLDLTKVVDVDDGVWIALLAGGPVAGLSAAAGKTGVIKE